MSEVFIISAVRTPIGLGKPEKGALFPFSPVDLTAFVLQSVLERAVVEPGWVDDVIWGCVTQMGDQGANLARLEGRIALEEFHRRFPNYTVDTDNLAYVHSSNVRGFTSVPLVIQSP